MPHDTARPVVSVFAVAVGLTLTAELVYFVVWGLLLFPGGNPWGKLVWTMTCGVAMGAVIGMATLLWVKPPYRGRSAIIRAALVMAAVGSYCAWLCSRIDARFDYFGGPENTALFILGGVIPAFVGGALFGWLVYGGDTRASAKVA